MTPAHNSARPTKRLWIACLFFLDQRWVHFLLIACLMTAASLWPHQAQWRWWKYLDHVVLDRYFMMRPTPSREEITTKLPHTRNIIMVEMNHSVPRPLLAQLINKLRLAKVVALDLMLVDREAELEPDPDGERKWYREYIREWRAEDRLLAQHIRAAGNVVLGTWPEERSDVSKIQVSGRRALQFNWQQPEMTWKHPPALLWESARYQAHVRVEPQEGIVRRVPLFENTARDIRQKRPGLGLAIAAAASGLSPQELNRLASKFDERAGFFPFGARRIPVQDGFMVIDYVGGRESFDYDENRVVYTLILNETYLPEDFKDKIVIV
ncbi:MAG: CHASE2 domain-containing protein, partial [Armatimonadota bacterium]|nr:CHASE2 domain-containing protein [Armatimonadota bacterium]